jgi:hypothetical protein
MKPNSIRLPWALLALLALLASACSAQTQSTKNVTSIPVTGQTPSPESYSDPFAYCAAIGTIDKPDARYTGPQITDEVIQGYLKAAGLQGSSEPMDVLKKTTIWRCMDNQVYACNFGANLPCDSKANTEKTPTQAMADFCKQNQNAEFIPMSVTGHATIYSWRCVKDAPEVLEQIATVDAAGFIAGIWYPVEKNP